MVCWLGREPEHHHFVVQFAFCYDQQQLYCVVSMGRLRRINYTFAKQKGICYGKDHHAFMLQIVVTLFFYVPGHRVMFSNVCEVVFASPFATRLIGSSPVLPE